MCIYYKGIYPVTHLYLHGSLRIQPKSGTKRASHTLKTRLWDTKRSSGTGCCIVVKEITLLNEQTIPFFKVQTGRGRQALLSSKSKRSLLSLSLKGNQTLREGLQLQARLPGMTQENFPSTKCAFLTHSETHRSPVSEEARGLLRMADTSRKAMEVKVLKPNRV